MKIFKMSHFMFHRRKKRKKVIQGWKDMIVIFYIFGWTIPFLCK